MSHGSGCYAPPHVARGAVQVIPESGGFEPAETIELIRRWPGATFFFAPTMIVRLLDSPALDGADMSNLKTIVYGGGPMYVADLLRGIDRLGQKFVQIYGQGESPMTITGLTREMHMEVDHPRYRERLASVGVARTDVEVKIFDAEDDELPAGEIGEVVVRGDVVMAGYWRNEAATAETLRGGWLHTGDMGAMDGDGFVTLKDRSKDMIISGGTNIYPREIEEVILTHPDVVEVSVIGKPHPEWGEDVCAFVVTRKGAAVDEAALDALCLDNIARFKRPKHYRFVDALPKNNYGKVLKTELRAWLAAEETGAKAS
jgi:long-chain acyl-CoA synthetase